MRYYGEEALGLIETLGMVPAISGADIMLKTADVKLISYENIGSTLVTVMVKGDVAAVKASVEAGAAAAAEIGKLTAQNVMPRPIKAVGDVVSVHAIQDDDQDAPQERPKAMGFIETFGIVYVLEAADAMVKAADVQLVGYENVASGYISVLVEGDVAACQAAVEAGVKAVEEMGTEVYSSLVIPTPHPDLKKITNIYDIESLLP
ncbi:BMC domain-containing protein [Desulfosediminicola ganghwensis]|uniref:BMC domain-containing protein n=1 Tax=Desulfosediminicola ganghwensis TaxID=2569540 RepID=UPI0010ACCBB5